MRSVADDLRREQRERDARRSIDERVALALAAGPGGRGDLRGYSRADDR